MKPFENNVLIVILYFVICFVGMIIGTLFLKGLTKNYNYLLDIMSFPIYILIKP